MRVSRSSSLGGRQRKRGPTKESAEIPNVTYADGKGAAVVAARLINLAKEEKPFFLVMGSTKPHLTFVAPKKYWYLYKRKDFAMPKKIGVPLGYPRYAQEWRAGELRSYLDIPTDGSPAEFPMAFNKRLIHGYHACASYLDDNVGLLFKALEKSGEADNTHCCVLGGSWLEIG